MTIDEAIKILEPYTGPEYQGIKFRTACEVAVSSLRAQKDTPPNDPLTLKQLREMDGEPVWWWNTTQKPTCTICICKGFMKEPMFVTYDFAVEDERKPVKFSRMKKWGYKPYRRKPEEGEHE